MLKVKASLESVKSRKLVSDDIGRTATFSLWSDDPTVMAKLDALYKRPLVLEITEDGKNG